MERTQGVISPERFASGLTFAQYLDFYHYIEYPAIYHKDRLVQEHIRAPRSGETPEQTRERAAREFMALQQSPFFRIWACAGVDEILSALHERLTVGSLA